MAYKHSTPSSQGVDGRKAGKCVSLKGIVPQWMIEEATRDGSIGGLISSVKTAQTKGYI